MRKRGAVMATRAKKAAEAVPLNGDVFPVSDGPALQFVALEVIDDDRVKKSSAWVSKRLALTYEAFDWRARKLLEDGVTEDVELLQCLAKVGELSQMEAGRLDNSIRVGVAGRKEARALLAKLKKKPASATKPTAVVAAPTQSEGDGTESSSASRTFDGRVMLWELVENLKHEGCPPVAELVDELTDEQQTAVLAVCREGFELGESCAGLDALSLLRRVGQLQANEHLEDWTLASLTLGAFGMPFELGTLLAEVRLAIRSA